METMKGDKMKPNLIAAIHDPRLFRSYVAGSEDGSLDSWSAWITFLKVLYGLPLDPSEHELIRQCTGRDPSKLPAEGFGECLVLCGRRSGKSKICGLVGAAEAVLGGRERHLDPGEIGMVAVLSPTRAQSRLIHSYAAGAFASTPILQAELAEEQRESFKLSSGVEISIITGDPRKARGYTLLAAVVDEISFFGLSEESKVRSDGELVRSIRPSLATTGGKLICVGTPYAAKGYSYTTFKRCWGNDEATTLVWYAHSLLMNPTLSSKIIENALAEDPVAGRVEYCTETGAFREDVDNFITRQQVESCVVSGRKELPPRDDMTYSAFCDVSGGRHDDAALSIAHSEGPLVVVDLLERFKAPHNPLVVAGRMTETLARYGLVEVVGDAYSAEWVKSTFASLGVDYRRATRSVFKDGIPTDIQKPKSQLYLELLPRLSSGTVELVDDEVLISQLSALQRRTRSGGRDVVDHPPGAKDDVANALAGAVVCSLEGETLIQIGGPETPSDPLLDPLLASMMADMRQNPPRPENPNEPLELWAWRASKGQRCKHPYLD